MRKILIVDDSRSARYVTRRILEKRGCEVDSTGSAKDALNRVNENQPDAIFMDFSMPEMNGLEALEALKANPKTAHIPVVMCGVYEAKYRVHSIQKGAIGFLEKPFLESSLDIIIEMIDYIISTQSVQNEDTAQTPDTSSLVPFTPRSLQDLDCLNKEILTPTPQHDFDDLDLGMDFLDTTSSDASSSDVINVSEELPVPHSPETFVVAVQTDQPSHNEPQATVSKLDHDLSTTKKVVDRLSPEDFETLNTDPELQEIFLEEADDLLKGIYEQVSNWVKTPQNLDLPGKIIRHVHILSGSAKLTNISSIAGVSKNLEDLLRTITNHGSRVTDEMLDLTKRTTECLERQVAAVFNNVPVPRFQQLIDELVQATASVPSTVAVDIDEQTPLQQSAPKSALTHPSWAYEEAKHQLYNKEKESFIQYTKDYGIDDAMVVAWKQAFRWPCCGAEGYNNSDCTKPDIKKQNVRSWRDNPDLVARWEAIDPDPQNVRCHFDVLKAPLGDGFQACGRWNVMKTSIPAGRRAGARPCGSLFAGTHWVYCLKCMARYKLDHGADPATIFPDMPKPESELTAGDAEQSLLPEQQSDNTNSADAVIPPDTAPTAAPGSAQAWCQDGDECLKNNLYQRALFCYDKALGVDDRYADAWTGKGRALGKLDRNHEGSHCLSVAIQLRQNPTFDPKSKRGITLPGNPDEDNPLQSMIRKSAADPAFADMFFRMFRKP